MNIGVTLAGKRSSRRHTTILIASCSCGNKLSNVTSLIILRTGEGLISFNKVNRVNFSVKKYNEAFGVQLEGFPFGGVCGLLVNTSNSGSGPEVRNSSLARCVVSLERELYSTLSLFTGVHKWVPATYSWG